MPKPAQMLRKGEASLKGQVSYSIHLGTQIMAKGPNQNQRRTKCSSQRIHRLQILQTTTHRPLITQPQRRRLLQRSLSSQRPPLPSQRPPSLRSASPLPRAELSTPIRPRPPLRPLQPQQRTILLHPQQRFPPKRPPTRFLSPRERVS